MESACGRIAARGRLGQHLAEFAPSRLPRLPLLLLFRGGQNSRGPRPPNRYAASPIYRSPCCVLTQGWTAHWAHPHLALGDPACHGREQGMAGVGEEPVGMVNSAYLELGPSGLLWVAPDHHGTALMQTARGHGTGAGGPVSSAPRDGGVVGARRMRVGLRSGTACPCAVWWVQHRHGLSRPQGCG
jgi:hypothetical protein